MLSAFVAVAWNRGRWSALCMWHVWKKIRTGIGGETWREKNHSEDL